LRLSAVGDITHTLPVVRTLQAHWPETKLTWIIGKLEHTLVSDIPGIEFIVFDKSRGWRAYWQLYQTLRGRRFDVLLHMQMSLRASVASRCVAARIRLGFDRQRGKDMQWLFTNARIDYQPRQHVIDSLLGFTEALGIKERQLQWDIPIPEDARQFARQQLDHNKPILVIAPCSSMAYRNWNVAGYAAVANHATQVHGMQVVLTGGTAEIEKQFGRDITAAMSTAPLDLIGKTNLKQLLAILEMASVVICPDAGTAHLANAVGTPVIGLYATTNPDRARPYNWPQLVVNKYPEAIQEKYGKQVNAVPWGTRVRDAGTMDRISHHEVIEKLDRVFNENLATH
jgi:heptosyltransferase I